MGNGYSSRLTRLSRLVAAVDSLLSAPSSEMYDRIEDLQLTYDALTERDLESLAAREQEPE